MAVESEPLSLQLSFGAGLRPGWLMPRRLGCATGRCSTAAFPQSPPQGCRSCGILLDWCRQRPLSSPLPSRKRRSQPVAELNRRKSPHLRKEIWQKLDSERNNKCCCRD